MNYHEVECCNCDKVTEPVNGVAYRIGDKGKTTMQYGGYCLECNELSNKKETVERNYD